VVITGYDSVFLYVQLVSILSDHIVQANFVQFDLILRGKKARSTAWNFWPFSWYSTLDAGKA